MTEWRAKFIGTWEKITDLLCSQVYPTLIEFHKNGLYSGTGAQPGRSPGWDIGTWNIVSPNQVKISTAHDAIITYEFSFSDDILTFVDPDGCEFKYQKVK